MTDTIDRLTEAYNCSDCGAVLKYKPGTDALSCAYCGGITKIENTTNTPILELDYHAFLTNVGNENLVKEKVVECKNCGASSCVQGNLKSLNCPNCSTSLIESDVHEERLIRPASLLPFIVNQDDVHKKLSKWVDQLWFKPTDLAKAALDPLALQGVYIPYWTYDTNTVSSYVGERGEYYKVVVKTDNGQRTETKTRWFNASGDVSVFYDDVMIPASGSLNSATLNKLEPWDKDKLTPFNNEYLSGFITEKYMVNLADGFQQAKKIIDHNIRDHVRKDIGGNTQKIRRISTQYNAISFKHILVPVYVSSYRYKNKLYHFYVNGRNGKITGDRPYSTSKILMMIFFILFFLFILLLIAS